MANYNEYKTDQQSNINWGETFKMGVKAPLVADRIFNTYQDALDYINVDDNPGSSAVAGLIVSVIHDTAHLQPGSTQPNRNGIYYTSDVFDEHGDVVVNEQGLPYLTLVRQTAQQVQSDWEETNAQNPSFIQHKPYIPEGYRTVNHETIIGDDTDINIHDGYYFPNAVQDRDGNWYGAVIIGDQVWLGENLRTTHFNDDLPTATQHGGPNMSTSTPYRYDNISSSVPFEKRGYLYNYEAAS
jgi:signal peptidase I